jgi:hypothetical protein
MKSALKVTLVDECLDRLGEVPMSYAEAKEIALLRAQLRTCWDAQDRPGALAALDRMARVAGNDNELTAEVRRWAVRFAG